VIEFHWTSITELVRSCSPFSDVVIHRLLLGRRFSGLVAIQPRHSLVTTGISGVVRHPSYVGALVFMLGGARSLPGWCASMRTFALCFPKDLTSRVTGCVVADQAAEP
jgi:protein-S-isoprenylcysteine O-methyltransferase Ste14